MRQILSIAGSDSGGGAGIQADIKAISANGGFALTVITSVTAQNTVSVAEAFDLPLDIIRAQMVAVFSDFEIAASKTGMLSTPEIVELVAGGLARVGAPHLVVDPVMVSKSGYLLLRDDAIETVKKRLLPIAEIATPNVHEAELLAQRAIRTLDDARFAAAKIAEYGCAVVLTGGHLESASVTDVLWDGSEFHLFAGERFETKNTHGTGCTFSAALATFLGQGKSLIESVAEAKEYTAGAIRNGLSIGRGHGPTHHFWRGYRSQEGGES